MAWSRAKLEHVAKRRLAERARLKPVEKAALAYARWQGLTDEVGIDRAVAKNALDVALADLERKGPDAWHGLEKLATELGDPAIIGLMQYSLRQSAERIRDAAAAPGHRKTPGTSVPTSGTRKKPSKERSM